MAHLAIGAAYSLRADRVRGAGDGRHAPIVGILRPSQQGTIVETDGGKRFVVRLWPSATATFSPEAEYGSPDDGRKGR